MMGELSFKKPSKLLIIIPSIILVLSIVFSIYNTVNNVFKLMRVSSEETSIAAQETKEMTFDEEGQYTVFLQTKGVVNGEYYYIPDNIYGLSLKVYNGNEDIEVMSPKMSSEITSGNREYVGVFEFKINSPGKYTVEAKFDDYEYENINLSIQKSNDIFKFVGGILSSLFIGFIGVGIFIGFLVFWIVKNNRYKKQQVEYESNRIY